MSRTRMIDLSYPLSSEMLVYPGNERPTFRWAARVNSEGYNLTHMSMIVHTGTHVDSPMHFIDNVPAIDEVPLERLFGTAKMFRYPEELHGQEITLDAVKDAGLDLGAGDIFVLATGIEAYAETAGYNAVYPSPSEELLRWLIDKRIAAYMTDATSIDQPGSTESPRHHLLLGAGVPIVENLRNLDQLPENRPFVICALPLKLAGREGSPCRAVALPDIEIL